MIFLLSVGLMLTVMLYFGISMSRKVVALDSYIKATKAELIPYQKIIRKAEEHRKTLKRVKKKMQVIKELEARRTGPVKIMDAMTQCVVPKEILPKRMWLKSMADEKGSLNIKGVAVDNPTIAQFMRNLEETGCFSAVYLRSSKQVKVANGLKFKEFLIACKPANPNTQPAAKGAK